MSRRAERIETRTSRRAERKAARARRRLEKLQRKRDTLKAKGKLARADRVTRKMKVVAAKGGVSPTARPPGVPGPPGVRRRAPRHKFRIRKGQRQAWSTKYRGWVNVKPRRKVRPRISEEIKQLAEDVQNLRNLITVIR